MGFIGGYLQYEFAFDYMPETRELLGCVSWAEKVRSGFDLLLAERPWSVIDYGMMVHVDFDDEEALYAYLQKVYDYLFQGADEVPVPPE